MAIERTDRVSCETALGTLSGNAAEVGNAEVTLNQVFAASSTNVAGTLAFAVADVQKFVFLADADCTVKFNSSGSPTLTVSLKAGRPWRWSKSDGYYTQPIPSDVTGIFVTCTAATRLRVAVLTS